MHNVQYTIVILTDFCLLIKLRWENDNFKYYILLVFFVNFYHWQEDMASAITARMSVKPEDGHMKLNRVVKTGIK